MNATKEISFAVTKDEARMISKIAGRAFQMFRNAGSSRDFLDIEMDITAVHANGCRLDLGRLFAADTFNFAHDIGGITRHLNRETGELQNCFCPRFAAREPIAA